MIKRGHQPVIQRLEKRYQPKAPEMLMALTQYVVLQRFISVF